MDNRTEQVNWIVNLASDIASYHFGPPEITKKDAESITEYWIGGANMPTWFDKHDKNLLIKFVREQL